MISATTPTISQVMPMALIFAMTWTPIALITVAMAIRIVPRMIALVAPDVEDSEDSPPNSWKPDHTSGSTLCRAMAMAPTLTM